MKKILITLLIFSCVFIKLTSQEKSRPKFYIGTDMGYAGSNINEIGYSGGFEITPYFGIAPFRYVPDLSFEVAVQMDFIGNWNPNTFDFRFRNITPQIIACYKFNFIFVKPYIKTGVGININSGDFIYNDYQNTIKENFDATNCVSFIFNPGVEVSFSKYVSLVGWGRFNFNVTNIESFNLDYYNLYIGTTSFGMGVKVNI
ncbi:MAG: hypothetical protein E7059_00770 [Treponema bryantii]|nr:hypothetical protein [Treponema bryantii]